MLRATVSPALQSRLYLLLAAVLWSTAGAAFKLSTLNAWQLAAGRSLVAAATIWLLLPGARRRLTRPVALVSLAYAGTVVLFVLANKATTSANAIFLQDTAPLWVLLLGPFLLGERPSKGELAAIPLFLVGLSLFFLDRLSPGQQLGNLLALASGVAFAFNIMGLRKLVGEREGVLVWGNLLAGAIALPFCLGGPVPTPTDVGLVLFLGVFQLALGYAAFARGLEHTPAVEASLLVLLEPVLNPIWAWLFAGERPGPWALTGGAIILAATAWRTLAATRRGAAPA